jgi:hypothetical protein
LGRRDVNPYLRAWLIVPAYAPAIVLFLGAFCGV